MLLKEIESLINCDNPITTSDWARQILVYLASNVENLLGIIFNKFIETFSQSG